MITKDLLDFVRAQLSRGVSRDGITASLVTQGWTPADVQEAFSAIDAPVAPVAPQQPAPAPAPVQATAPVVSAAPIVAAMPAMASMPNMMSGTPVMASVPSMTAAALTQTPVAAAAGGMAFAGFWLRVVAVMIDSLILQAVIYAIAFCLVSFADIKIAEAVAPLASVLLAILYYALFESSAKGATPGKMAVGIKVVGAVGNRVSFLRALGRYLAKFISGAILGIGFLMAAFTEKKQGLHDMIAGTFVVKSRLVRIGRALLILALTLVVLGAGSAAFARFFIFPKIVGDFSALFPGGSISIGSSSDNPGTQAAIMPMTATTYDAALSTPLTGVQSAYEGTSTYAGPAYLVWDDMWLTIALPNIPNLDRVQDTASVDISHVYSKSGLDIDNATSTFETDQFFKNISLSAEQDPVPHYKGHRSLTLFASATNDDISRIEGTLVLSLPLSDGSTYAKSYPFVLDLSIKATSTASTASSAAAPISAADKEAIIAGILRTKVALSSTNPASIRAYLAKAVTTADDKSQLDQMSDSDVLKEAKLAASMYSNVTDAVLRSLATVFVLTSDKASVTLPASSDGVTETISATRANGTWF